MPAVTLARMKHTLLACLAIGFMACGGDDSTDATDVPPSDSAIDSASAIDGPATADAPATPDAPSGTACTGALYDPCTVGSQCTSGMCKAFGSSGFTVCTQACSPSTPCPTTNGIAATCNNMGICKPASANTCTR